MKARLGVAVVLGASTAAAATVVAEGSNSDTAAWTAGVTHDESVFVCYALPTIRTST